MGLDQVVEGFGDDEFMMLHVESPSHRRDEMGHK